MADVEPETAQAGSGGGGLLGARAIRPHVSLWRHRVVALAVGAAIASVGLVFAWFKGVAVYSATAVVHVAPRFAKVLEEDKELELQSNTQYLWFINQQTRTIGRYDIVSAVLEADEELRKAWMLPEESVRRAAERLQGALSIRAVRDTYLITIGLESKDPVNLEKIVNAVVDEYLRKSKLEEIYASDARIERLADRRQTLQDEIDQMVRERLQIARELGVTTFTEADLNPLDMALVAAETRLAQAREERIVAQAALEVIDPQVSRISGQALESIASNEASKDAGLNGLKANIFKRLSEIVSEESGLAEGHPTYSEVRREREDLLEALDAASRAISEREREEALRVRGAELSQAQQVEDELLAQVEELRSQVGNYSARYGAAVNLTGRIARARDDLSEVTRRIDFLQLESSAPGFVRLVTPARFPELPIKGGRKKLFLIFLVLAAGAGSVLPTAIDLIDPRVFTPRQLQKAVGFELLPWLPLVTNGHEKELSDQQNERLAERLVGQIGGLPAVITLTGASLAASPARLCRELTKTLTARGLDVAVVEVDPLGEIASSEELQRGVTYRVLQEPPEASSLSAGVSCFFDELRREHDVVLAFAPAVSLSALAEICVRLSDAVLVATRAGRIPKGRIKDLVEQLEALDPKAIGAVLFDFDLAEGGGRYTELPQERAVGRLSPPSRLLSPWLWP